MSVELAIPLVPWLRERHWIALDVVVATVLLIVLVGGVLGRTPQFAIPQWAPVTTGVLAAAPVAVRRIWPVGVLAVVLPANTVLAALAVGGSPAIVVALAGYTVALRRPPGCSLALLALALGVSVPAELVPLLLGQPSPEWQASATLAVASVLVLSTAWTTGLAVRARRLYAARSAAERTHRAVAEERLRIARELHDVITHGLTLITVKASVASYRTDSRPDEVRAALDVIETTGRDTLSELRRMLGVLRSDDVTTSSAKIGEGLCAPVPGLADIQGLVGHVREGDAGVSVELDIRGRQGTKDLPPAVSLSTYRIVQEALSNVIKHAAPAHCRVRIEIGNDDIRIEVSDDGHRRHVAPPSPTGGHGIIGMRERVLLFGGSLKAGPLPNRGFRVIARLPLACPQPGSPSERSHRG